MSIFIYCNPPNALRSKKAMLRKRDISGYEYELSIHLNTSYISFALVRVLRTGAFCFFQLFSEKRTQEPSPERVRSERGREDKPLTPSSTPRGKEVNSMELSSSDKERIQHQYDALAKKTLVGEAKSHRRTLAKRAAREVPFFGFERKRTRAAFHNGRIQKRLFPFSSVRL